MDVFYGAVIALALITNQATQSQQPKAAGARVFRVGGGVTPPVLISKTEPEYSEAARKAKFEGTAMLYVQIDPLGQATNIKVVRRLGLGLDEKAMEAVARWQFKPGLKQDKPVTVEATVEVNFRLLGQGWSITREAFPTAVGAPQPVLRDVPTPPKCKSDGKLTLSLTVDSDGSARDARLVSGSSNSSLNHAIMDSIRKWTFDPLPQSVSGQIDIVCHAH